MFRCIYACLSSIGGNMQKMITHDGLLKCVLLFHHLVYLNRHDIVCCIPPSACRSLPLIRLGGILFVIVY